MNTQDEGRDPQRRGHDRSVGLGHPVDSVVGSLQARLDDLAPEQAYLRRFLDTYQRTTAAVGRALDDGLFEDAAWVGRWDVAFAGLYLEALDAYLSGAPISRPWRLAFDAPPELPGVAHVLLGINAHVNFDLPQALLSVISDTDFTDRPLMASRRRDHERIDVVLSSRVAAEDDELGARSRSLTVRALQPLYRLSSAHFLRQARDEVWRNTVELQVARTVGPAAYDARLTELEGLSADQAAGLDDPRRVMRLVVAGFGVTLPQRP